MHPLTPARRKDRRTSFDSAPRHCLSLSMLQIRKLDSYKVAACAGPQADCAQFVEYVQRNMALNEFRTGLKMSTAAASSFIRNQLAQALRSNPYQVNLLVGGWDKDVGPALYYMDYLAACTKMNFGAHGYAAYFVLSTMDRHWKAGMSVDEALELARMCVRELATRFIMNQPKFTVKIADKDGVREVAL
jgi:20S proteasome subunit beta 4